MIVEDHDPTITDKPINLRRPGSGMFMGFPGHPPISEPDQLANRRTAAVPAALPIATPSSSRQSTHTSPMST